MQKIKTVDLKGLDAWMDMDRGKDKQLVTRVEYYENGNVKLIEYMPPMLITLPQGDVKLDKVEQPYGSAWKVVASLISIVWVAGVTLYIFNAIF